MTYVLPALVAVLVWWASTGLMLALNRQPPARFNAVMSGATVLLALALAGWYQSLSMSGVDGVYLGFVCGLIIWGWHEMSYYLGWVTGLRSTGCPRGCRGWRHFVHATEASIFHELAIAVTAMLMALLSLGAVNSAGLTTFVLLWLMRLSAKFNLFLGVRNIDLGLLPEHLRYLDSFIRRRGMNPLFPLSVTAITVTVVLLAAAALRAPAGSVDAVAATLPATLALLALIEHWLLMLPLSLNPLWHCWGVARAAVGRPPRGRGVAEAAAGPLR